MRAPVKHVMDGQIFWLSPERIIYWENEKTIIASDLHFGKTGHFRKAGIAMPQSVFKEDLQRLVAQLQHFSPRRLLVVGDLFHSVANKELDFFRRWRDDLPGLTIELVKGNHDILRDDWYGKAGISVIKDNVVINGICFTHDKDGCKVADETEVSYTISGHIHPGVKIHGLAKQSLSFPCFYFTDTFAVLPAFSHFTGMFNVRPKEGDDVFAIADNCVIKLRI